MVSPVLEMQSSATPNAFQDRLWPYPSNAEGIILARSGLILAHFGLGLIYYKLSISCPLHTLTPSWVHGVAILRASGDHLEKS